MMEIKEPKLIPVLELEPYSYCEQLKMPDKIYREKWDKYWENAFTSAGFDKIEPIESGSFFVRLETISDFNLRKIFDHEIDLDCFSEEEEYSQQISAFYGGLVLADGDKIILSPNCCGKLSDINEWETILNSQEDKWHGLWIGHPYAFFKRMDEKIYLTGAIGIPGENTRAGDEDILFSFDRSELQKAIRGARVEMLKFRKRLVNVLKPALAVKNLEKFSEILVYGDYE